MHLDESLFTFEPSFLVAKAISDTYKKKALNSILTIADAINKITSLPFYKTFDERIEELKSYSVSSMFYNYNTKLIHSLIELKDIHQTTTTLEKLSNENISNLIHYYPKISNLNNYDWAMEFGRQTVEDYKKINSNKYANIKPANKIIFKKNIGILSQAMALLKTKAYSFYVEVINYVSDILLFEGKGISGGTSSKFMNSIFIRIPIQLDVDKTYKNKITLVHLTELVYYLEQLIHETAHLHLDQLMEFDPIVNNNEKERFNSPLREDLRPMRGVFHATFVLARLKRFFSIITLSGSDEDFKNKRLITINDSLSSGIDTIKKYGQLTVSGKKLFHEMTQASNS